MIPSQPLELVLSKHCKDRMLQRNIDYDMTKMVYDNPYEKVYISKEKGCRVYKYSYKYSEYFDLILIGKIDWSTSMKKNVFLVITIYYERTFIKIKPDSNAYGSYKCNSNIYSSYEQRYKRIRNKRRIK